MNKDEKEIMNLIVKAHNKYVNLETMHPADIGEWANHIHGL